MIGGDYANGGVVGLYCGWMEHVGPSVGQKTHLGIGIGL